ncbi:hypothetical protein [Streptomyces sp. WMMC940]|uniref:hypothetical protein n=1 Tax=Streptomyces sp. WMMC940 TaxID=3015153 RepID=UPI0022B74823|nr:hypothetical protein [Streptomyces sp. WMMC940]MCZ7456958.1 hypothetical protein [Streptomyces sp. WMMC940]
MAGPSTSVARFFSVRPSVMISLNALGTPWLTDSINFTISSRPLDAYPVTDVG